MKWKIPITSNFYNLVLNFKFARIFSSATILYSSAGIKGRKSLFISQHYLIKSLLPKLQKQISDFANLVKLSE